MAILCLSSANFPFEFLGGFCTNFRGFFANVPISAALIYAFRAFWLQSFWYILGVYLVYILFGTGVDACRGKAADASYSKPEK